MENNKNSVKEITTLQQVCKIAGIKPNSLVDGEGIRFTIFLQGCPHQCKGCHSPHTWNPEKGIEITIQEILKQYEKTKTIIDGITISGGDPFAQPEALTILLEEFKKRKENIWVWTGYPIEYLYHHYPEQLKNIDVLIDNPYDQDKPTTKPWRGSDNQRMYKQNNNEWEEL